MTHRQDRDPAHLDPVHLDPDESFMRRLADEREELARFETASGSPGGLDDGDHRRIEALAHRLAGAAGVFGFDAVGVAAAALEDHQQARAASRRSERQELQILLEHLIALLDEALREG